MGFAGLHPATNIKSAIVKLRVFRGSEGRAKAGRLALLRNYGIRVTSKTDLLSQEK
jgi:hypothetical protein